MQGTNQDDGLSGAGTAQFRLREPLDSDLQWEAGLVLVSEAQHHSFGRDLVGQNWELALRDAGPLPRRTDPQCAARRVPL